MDVQTRCICPPKDEQIRHPDGDTFSLRETLDFRGVATLRWAIAVEKDSNPGMSIAQALAAITEHYLLVGLERWTLQEEARNDKGRFETRPIPINANTIREHLLSRTDEAIVVADAADDLYGAVVLPLLTGSSTSSPPLPTTESTSPRTGSSEKRPKRSRPSSISTTPTGDTVTISSSLELDSSSSPSSESAA